MRSGETTVGHPINVATGTVYLTRRDVLIPGKIKLTWERRYSTALLDQVPSPMGRGWTTQYFATLRRLGSTFQFLTPEGDLETFDDPEGKVEHGELIRNPGTFQELAKNGGQYVVTRWNIYSGEVRRYTFLPGRADDAWALASIQDPAGRTLQMSRDPSGRLVAIGQLLERRALLIHYTPQNLIESVCFLLPDRRQQVLARYEHDAQGNLVAAHDVLECGDRYEYDENSRMVRETSKDGGVFYFHYDDRGRCVKTSGLDHYDEKSLKFLDHLGWTEVTNSLGHATRYQWKETGQVVTVIDPLGGVWRTEYDEHGRIIAKKNPLGGTTKYEYDANGNRGKLTDPNGGDILVGYNSSHLPTRLTDRAGHTWTREYDELQRLTATEDPLGQRQGFEYDSRGHLVKIVRPSHTLLLRHSDNGMTTEIADALGNTRRYELDPLGSIISQTNPLGDTVRFQYDAAGNLVEANLPDGSTLQYQYDSARNLIGVKSGCGRVIRFRFGTCRRLLERIDGERQAIRYVWGSEPFRLEKVINAKGECYTLLYDACGRRTREVGFDGRLLQFSYDAAGRCVSFTNGAQETIGYVRDKVGRILKKTLADGSAESFAYNSAGQLVSATNSDCELKFERDPLGRPVCEAQDQYSLHFEYDATKQLIALKTSLGYRETIQFSHSSLWVNLTTNYALALRLQRDNAGREVLRELGRGVILTQGWDPVGRLIRQSIEGASVPTLPIHRTYHYDRSGNLLVVQDSSSGTTTSNHDLSGRLQSVSRDDLSIERFEYDSSDNLSRITRSGHDETLDYTAGSRLLRKGSSEYSFDGNGRLIQKIQRRGDQKLIWLYRWNSLDRLVSITTPEGETWKYSYDPLGRRISKQSQGVSTRYVWRGDLLLHEINHLGSISTLIRDPHTRQLAGAIQGSSAVSVVGDHLGTPQNFIHSTNIATQVPAHGAWGAPDSCDTERVEHTNYFKGQVFDPESKLFYSLFRYYDAEAGRYVSQDPLRLGASLNSYAYANPVTTTDPLGINPDNIALGMSNPPVQTPMGTYPQPDGLYTFANNVGASPYPQFDPALTNARGQPAIGAASVYLAMQDASAIHFNLDGYPTNPEQLAAMIQAGREGDAHAGQNFTNWELATIMDDPELLAKTTFYRNGEEEDEPPKDCA